MGEQWKTISPMPLNGKCISAYIEQYKKETKRTEAKKEEQNNHTRRGYDIAENGKRVETENGRI